MMQNVNVKPNKELRTIEIGQANDESVTGSPSTSSGNPVIDEQHSTFGPDDMSICDEDEASEVDSFLLDETEMEDTEHGLQEAKFLLAAEAEQGIQTVDPQTQARLEALLEAAGINKLSSRDGKALSDPEVLRTLTSSVSSALDEAAQALHRMRDPQGQPYSADGVSLEAGAESESMSHRSGHGAAADASEEGESLLSLACSAGYYELAQVLLAMKANVEDRGIKGDCTPLMEAASGGHVDIVRLLLLHNADINAQSSAGNTPLHYGACSGFKEVVEELIKNGANVEIHNENGHTPLMEAASAGHVDVAKILLDHGAGINTHSNEFKESALTLACYKGHLDMVKFLLEAGADQEHKTDEMHTALMEASMDGHVEVARLLLDSGAQVNMPADSFESPLTLAACGGHIELASLLIERGANIEEVNDEGYTPLMEAAREGHEDMVALLLSHDADINAQTEETQETALTLACCGGFLEVADFLLRSGAHIELGCSTPLMEAAQEGHLELVSFLLHSGANVEAHTGTGDTALTYACENGHTDVAEALLEAGAKLEHESEGGRTPLMKAARAGHLCTVQFLISKGADVNRTTTSNDHTVLSLACAGGHLAVVDLLLQHNADPNHKLKDGSTMVIEAAKGGHTQVVKLLLEWPNRFLVNTTTEHLSQLNMADMPAEEPRVPVQGLANIVPPGEPDPQIPNVAASIANAIHGKTPKSSVNKRSVIGQPDGKGGNKFGGTNETFPQLFNESALIDDKAIDKDEKLSSASREERILCNQQIKEELKKVEEELAQQQLQFTAGLSGVELTPEQQQQMQAKLKQAATLSASSVFAAQTAAAAGAGAASVNRNEQWNEELAKLLELPSQPDALDQFSDFAKLVCEMGPTATSTSSEAYFPQLLLQQPNQVQPSPLSAPPPPPSTSSTVVGSAPANNPASSAVVAGSTAAVEGRAAGGGGKNSGGGAGGGAKRNGTNKTGRTVKNLSQALQQPPPPPPPPPPQTLVHPGKGARQLSMTTAQKQQLLTSSAQPIVFQNEHNGGSQSMESSMSSSASSSSSSSGSQQTLSSLDSGQAQQRQQQQLQAALTQQQQQGLPLAYSPLLAPGQAQHELLQHMLSSQPGLQQQLQMQQITQQVQAGQHVLQGVPSTGQVVSTAHLSPQQQQQYQQQQQQAQLLQQQLQQFTKGANAAGNHTVAINKPQVVRKQQRMVQTSSPASLHQANSVINVDETLAQAAAAAQSGLPPGSQAGLYAANVDVDSQTESNHDTALTLACAGGHAELVSLLLAKGADIEHRDKKGFTPLILAATTGHVEVVEILLNLNADIEAQSERTKDTPLSLACSGGRYEVVELLLNKGANKEHRNVSDYTPLSLAASGGYVNIIKLLLSHNAEINSRTGSKLGISPLMLAAMNGHTAAVKLLLDMGSDINAQIETNRNTALTLACFQGRHEVVSLLLDRKANIEHRAKTGLTPLMEAASGGYVEVGRVLLDKGADVNAPPVPSSRDTALTIAADKGHYRFVELLLHRGASVDVKNKKGNSPLWLACNGGHNDVVSLLVQADADIDSQDNRKVSCLMAAFRRGHLKVVKWMVKKVTQFPSENEIKRYIATITDKELQKKCNQCADVIVTAKDRQAAEANKNADSLLEEIKQEKEQAAHKAEMASKRRERRRERKKKGKQKDAKDKESGKNSSPEPDGDSNKKDDDEEEDDDDDDSSNQESSSVGNSTGSTKGDASGQSAAKGGKGGGSSSGSAKVASMENNGQSSRLPPTLSSAVNLSTAPSPTASAGSSGSGTPATAASSARANRESRKKQQKAARETRREANEIGLRQNMKSAEIISKKQVTEALQVTLAKVTTLIESVVTVTAMSSQANSSTGTQVTSSHSNGRTSSGGISGMANISSSNANSNNAGLNGNKSSRTKKSNDVIKQPTSGQLSGIGDLDDFGVPIANVLKNLANGKGGVKKANDSKRDIWIDDYRFLEKSVPNRLATSAPSPRKGQKKDEGWKQVVRKSVSKKLSVPANVTARLIGKGGCNINAIREISGAHVEVEKAKGNSDRTVTIKGCPEAIRQANNLINAMVDEPDKDISEILSRVTNSHKQAIQSTVASEKSHHHGHQHHPPASQVPTTKTPVSIVDFAIGTFSVPTSGNPGLGSKSPAQVKTGRQGQLAGTVRSPAPPPAPSSSIGMGPSIGAWQNPVPGSQATPSSPRRSPQKQIAPSPAPAGLGRTPVPPVNLTGEKSSARQLVFGASESRTKRSASPTPAAVQSSASLTFTATTTSTIRGAVPSTAAASTASLTKGSPDPRLSQGKATNLAVGPSSNAVGSRFPRPGNSASGSGRMEPLPIVTSGGNSNHSQSQQPASSAPALATASQQPAVGEYSPFHNNLFTNFLPSKKEEDKLDFASVAAAGVVTTTPTPHTPSHPANSNNSTVDPALQAKAPGFKIPQRGPIDQDPSITSYRLSSSGGATTVGSINAQGMNPMASGILRPPMDMDYQQLYLQYQLSQMPDQQGLGHAANFMRMELGGRGPMPHAFLPHQAGMGGLMGHQPQAPLPQKEEYSKPHRPMQLPEIKGALNPNAPEFQLPGQQPLMNGFDSPGAGNPFSSMMGLGRPGLGPMGSEGPNHGVLPPMTMMQPDLLAQAYMMQQNRAGPSTGNSGTSPPQLGGTSPNNGLSSPPQPGGVVGPHGISPSPGGASFGQAHQPPSPMPGGGGRPNSAPSVQQDPGPIPRSGSPLSTHTPPLEPQPKLIQPIGGERRRVTGRPGAFGVGPNPWGYANSTGYGQEWSSSGSPVMSAATLPSSVMTSSVLPGATMAYQRGEGQEDTGPLDYGSLQYSDTMPSADGDHSLGPSMLGPVMYGNGPSYSMEAMFPPKGSGDSQTPPLWNPSMTSAPSDQGDTERWQTWSQQAEL